MKPRPPTSVQSGSFRNPGLPRPHCVSFLPQRTQAVRQVLTNFPLQRTCTRCGDMVRGKIAGIRRVHEIPGRSPQAAEYRSVRQCEVVPPSTRGVVYRERWRESAADREAPRTRRDTETGQLASGESGRRPHQVPEIRSEAARRFARRPNPPRGESRCRGPDASPHTSARSPRARRRPPH